MTKSPSKSTRLYLWTCVMLLFMNRPSLENVAGFSIIIRRSSKMILRSQGRLLHQLHDQGIIVRGQSNEDVDDDESSVDIAGLVDVVGKSNSPPQTNQNKIMSDKEKVWRYVKKPLLSIGAKGASLSHGNSLRQLLDAHTVVKVKINTLTFAGDLQAAYEALKGLVEESTPGGGSSLSSKGIMELIEAREKDSVILVGIPGTRERIASGEFPPPPKLYGEKKTIPSSSSSIKPL